MTTWTILLAALAGFAAFIAICLFLPVRMTRRQTFPSPSFDAVDNSRKTLAQIFGGAALILTFAWSFSKDSETLEQARQQIANQQYIAAAQMLGESNSIPTRAAGIFSMGRIAEARVEYHMPVRDALQAFLSLPGEPANRSSEVATHPRSVDADNQAAIEVLGHRNLARDDPNRWLYLGGTYLVGGNFHKLEGFRGACFQNAFLSGTDFRGADLTGAWMDGASMADWRGYGPNWSESVPLQPTWQRWERFTYIANFEGAKLVRTSFTGADLSGANFAKADIAEADFRRAVLSRVDFTDAIHLSEAKFKNKDGSESACADVSPKFNHGEEINIPSCK